MLRLAPLFFLSLSVHAAETSGAGMSAGTYLQAALALALIIGLLLGTAWLAKKISGDRGFSQGKLKLVGGITLGPRERIVVVEVEDTWLVVGIVPGQIRTLHQLPKGPEGDLGDQAATTDAPFAQWLKNMTERGRNA